MKERSNSCLSEWFLTFYLYSCTQYWMLSKAGEIRRDEACLDYSGNDVVLYPCHGSKGNQVNSKFAQIQIQMIDFYLLFSPHKNSFGHLIQVRNTFDTVHPKSVWQLSNQRIKSSWKSVAQLKNHKNGV